MRVFSGVSRPAYLVITMAALSAAAPIHVRSQETNAHTSQATVTVVENDGAQLYVIVENNRNSPLVRWSIESTWASAASGVSIAPHARGTLSVPIANDRSATRPTVLSLAVFADGYYEGFGRSFDEWMSEHTEQVDDLRYWVGAFMVMPRVSISEMRTYLSDHVAERAGRETHQVRHVSDRVQELLRRYPEGPFIARPIDQLRKDVEGELIAATQTPPGDVRPGRVDAVTAASLVSAETTRTKSYSLVIENLRDVAIEAYGIEQFDPVTGRVTSGMSSDMCSIPVNEPPTPGHGRIQPHERRDLHQMYDPPKPVARLAFVMFDDLVFEGDPARRERLLHEREELADEYSFALATLEAAVTKPPAQLETFLTERRTERIRELLRNGKQSSPASPTEGFLRDLKSSSPERFLANVEQTRMRLEEGRRRLLRHLARS